MIPEWRSVVTRTVLAFAFDYITGKTIDLYEDEYDTGNDVGIFDYAKDWIVSKAGSWFGLNNSGYKGAQNMIAQYQQGGSNGILGQLRQIERTITTWKDGADTTGSADSKDGTASGVDNKEGTDGAGLTGDAAQTGGSSRIVVQIRMVLWIRIAVPSRARLQIRLLTRKIIPIWQMIPTPQPWMAVRTVWVQLLRRKVLRRKILRKRLLKRQMPTLRRQMLRRKTLRTLEIRNSHEIRQQTGVQPVQKNRMQDRPLVTARVIRHLEQIRLQRMVSRLRRSASLRRSRRPGQERSQKPVIWL